MPVTADTTARRNTEQLAKAQERLKVISFSLVPSSWKILWISRPYEIKYATLVIFFLIFGNIIQLKGRLCNERQEICRDYDVEWYMHYSRASEGLLRNSVRCWYGNTEKLLNCKIEMVCHF